MILSSSLHETVALSSSDGACEDNITSRRERLLKWLPGGVEARDHKPAAGESHK